MDDQLTVERLLDIVEMLLSEGVITKDTRVLLSSDDEMNDIHALWGWSLVTKKEAMAYGRPEFEEKEYLILC